MARLSLLAVLLLSAPCSAWAAKDCTSLKTFRYPDTTIEHADEIAVGTPALPGFAPKDAVPAFCRVRGVLRPSADSAIHFEVWLPAEWNSRVLNVGNGGFAGSIYYSQMAANVRHGYATAGTDAGHQADAEDASWAFGHPEKVKDFGWRAVHLTAGVSKALVKALYDRPERKAYFDACSDGGREALMEAQRFPEDYDGILAGAPANNWARMLSGGLAVLQSMARDPRSYIPRYKLPAITKAALAACDAQDGLADGVISDPERCRFDPHALLCQGGDTESCLTAPQVEALQTIYAGARDDKGQRLFPGLLPGDEFPSWASWVLGPAPAGSSGANYTSGFFRYMVLQDPTWNPLTANAGEMAKLAVDRTARDVDATDPDLSRLTARGGKLLIYHGWNDPAISPWNSVEYFQSVQKVMGEPKTASAVRLYMVPGMEHCAGGPGPNRFGQLGMDAAAPDAGAMTLLESWVEEGKAPGAILAGKPVPEAAGSPSATAMDAVRPICPYPQRAVYDGKGDSKAASGFACRLP